MADRDERSPSVGMPLLQLDSADAVKLRIAQENLRQLISLKREYTDDIVEQVTVMCDEVISFPNREPYYDHAAHIDFARELFEFVKDLGIYQLKQGDTKGISGTVGRIRAALAIWRRSELDRIYEEVERKLSQE